MIGNEDFHSNFNLTIGLTLEGTAGILDTTATVNTTNVRTLIIFTIKRLLMRWSFSVSFLYWSREIEKKFTIISCYLDHMLRVIVTCRSTQTFVIKFKFIDRISVFVSVIK